MGKKRECSSHVFRVKLLLKIALNVCTLPWAWQNSRFSNTGVMYISVDCKGFSRIIARLGLQVRREIFGAKRS